MTPENALGRMIHNFTATAYEVAEFSYDNLVFYNFVASNKIDKAQMKWETVELATNNNGIIEYKHGQINRYPAVMVEFTGLMPGSIVYLDDEEILIGVNGSYYAQIDKPIKNISIPEDTNYIGFMTYGFYGESVSKFEEVFNVELNEVPIQTVIGSADVLGALEDARTKVVNFYFLRFRK
jgi:hypothetical protein